MLRRLARVYCGLIFALLIGRWLWMWWGMTQDCWQRAHDCLTPVGEAMRLQCMHQAACWTLGTESLRHVVRDGLQRVWHAHWLWLTPPALLLVDVVRLVVSQAWQRLAVRFER